MIELMVTVVFGGIFIDIDGGPNLSGAPAFLTATQTFLGAVVSFVTG